MKRRNFLNRLAGLGVAPWVFAPIEGEAATATGGSIAEIQARWQQFVSPGAAVAKDNSPLTKTKEAWHAELPQDSYAVLFEEDTEPPGSSLLNNEKRAGVFVCRACSLPLFTSEMKYESGTGWPSFFTSIPHHLSTRQDFKLILPRTEYHCSKCGGHQGHVFDDGPAPSGERWCNNGVALRFVALK